MFVRTHNNRQLKTEYRGTKSTEVSNKMMCSCGGRLVSMGTDKWRETKTKKHVTDNKLEVHESETKDKCVQISNRYSFTQKRLLCCCFFFSLKLCLHAYCLCLMYILLKQRVL